jgi:protein involved in polysaccharide export with SLBB domain
MRRALFPCALSLVALTACATLAPREPSPVAPATDPVRLQQFLNSRRGPGVARNSRIGPGDSIAVHVADLDEASREYVVSPEGEILLPFAGETRVAGKSSEEAATVIAQALEDVLLDPAVKVDLVDAARGEATIEGAVERPGKVRLGMKGKTLLDALAMAGGLSADAAGVIRITPGLSAPSGLFAEGIPGGSAESPIEIAASDVLRANGPVRLYLRPGDRIEVVPLQGGAVASAAPRPLAERDLLTRDGPLEVLPEAGAEREDPPDPGELTLRSDLREQVPRVDEGAPRPRETTSGARADSAAIERPEPPRAAPALVYAPPAGLRSGPSRAAGPRPQITVSGRVRSPGNQLLAQSGTVTQAVMRAAPTSGADVTQIEVKRRGGSETWRIRVNLVEVQEGKSPDLLLQEGDTIVVP